MGNKQISIVVLVAFISFGAGTLLGSQSQTQATLLLSGPEEVPEGIDLDPVWKAWRLLEEKFVSATTTAPLSKQDRVWGIVSGLADSYDDPYTTFMPPQEAKDFQQEISGSFGGVGMEMGIREDVLTVIAPLKGTPAERAGILSGDYIVEIEGKSTRDISVDEAVSLIRGEVGSTVNLTLAREGATELIHVAVVRETINIPTLDVTHPNDDVTVIALYNFGGTATTEFRKALRDYIASGDTGLVVDLRGNPGGYLDAAVEISSWFLPLGKVVVSEDFGKNGEPVVHRSKGYDVMPPNARLAILVDGGSASASEIVAGALKEQQVAKIIGDTTFGKGSVQELVDLTPETALKITVARWLTPNGHSISAGGLAPDLLVKRTPEDFEAKRDPQLDAALEYLATGVLPAPVTASSTASTTSSTTLPRE